MGDKLSMGINWIVGIYWNQILINCAEEDYFCLWFDSIMTSMQGGQLQKKLTSGQYYNEYEQLPKKKFVSDTVSLEVISGQLHSKCECIVFPQNAESSFGELPENIPRNRYKDILPYDVSEKIVARGEGKERGERGGVRER